MHSPAETIRRRREKILNYETEEFQWLLGTGHCEECGRAIEMPAVHGIEVCLNGAHFGDLAVCILCPYCDSLYYMHARKHLFGGNILEPAEKPLVRREKLVRAQVNNLLEMTDEEFEELLPPGVE